MPFKEFGKNDLFYNKVKTFPECDFIIYDSKVYFNNFKNSDDQAGENGNILGVPQGFISLYELNVDRPIDTGGSGEPPSGKSIYPFITKQGSRIAFKTISTSEFDRSSQFSHGSIVKSSYPLSASIKRTYLTENSLPIKEVTHDEDGPDNAGTRFHGSYKKTQGDRRFILALRNSFNEYVGKSHHYSFDDSVNPYANRTDDMGFTNWDKSKQEMNLLEIPSIFYGSSLKRGSVILQMYKTGSLIAECRDINRDGELIQVSGSYDSKKHNGKVAGVVLYNEGFVALTGSWNLTAADTQDQYVGTTNSRAKWCYFGSGANDKEARGKLTQVLFKLNFKGVNYVPTITMMAHMPKGEFNSSTNPTAYDTEQAKNAITTTRRYIEFEDLKYKKLEHTEYTNYTGSFVKQTYVSKIGIYDDQKRLIAVAKLASPVRKTENREYTFKLKLDI